MSRNHQNSHLTSSLLTSIGCSSLSLATFSAEVTDSRGKVKQLYADLSQLLTDCFYVLVISVMIILNGNIYMVITDCKFLCCGNVVGNLLLLGTSKTWKFEGCQQPAAFWWSKYHREQKTGISSTNMCHAGSLDINIYIYIIIYI